MVENTLPDYFSGWKEVANYYDIPKETLRRWHHFFLKAPILKSSNKKKSRVAMERGLADTWVKTLITKYPSLRHSKSLRSKYKNI